MPIPIEPSALANEADTQSNERFALLDEVNFKWLMAGLGLWIDMERFRLDACYANHFLELAEATESRALRNCAASLRGQRTMISH